MLDLRLAVTEAVSGDAPVKVRCPVHNDPTESMAVFRDNIHCFGCGFHRNDWDEALAVLLGISIPEASLLGDRYESVYVPQQKKLLGPLPLARARMYHKYLREVVPHRAEWFYARGLTDDTIDRELLGHDGFRFSVPVYDSKGALVTIRFRRDDTILPGQEDDGKVNPKYSGLKGRNGVFLYGARWLSQMDSKYAIVTEGELDALLLRQRALPSCAVTNGAGQVHGIPPMVQALLPRVQTLLLATDQDEAGDKAAIQTAQAAHGLGMKAYRLTWLQGKDITEFLMLGGDLKSDVMKGVWNGSRFDFNLH